MSRAIKSLDKIPQTKQELVDLVFEKLNKQQSFGYDPKTGSCQYRHGRNCCAIGFLMPDSVAAWLYKNMTVACTISTLLSGIENRLRQDPTLPIHDWYSRLLPFEDDFLLAVQNVHDMAAGAKIGRREAAFYEQLYILEYDWHVNVDKIRDMDWSWLEYHLEES